MYSNNVYIWNKYQLSRFVILFLLIGFGISGCVSADGSYFSTSASRPMELTSIILDNKQTDHNRLSVLKQDNAASNYQATYDNNQNTVPDPRNTIPDPRPNHAPYINPLSKDGQIYVTQKPSETKPQKSKNKGSFFSQLFQRRSKEVAYANIMEKKPHVETMAPQQASLRATQPLKEQTGRVATVQTHPSIDKAKNKTNIFASIFGLKANKKDNNIAEKPLEIASLIPLTRLSPYSFLRQNENVEVACLKPELLRLLDKIEKYYRRPIIITSGYRSEKHNRRIGGATFSQHTNCEAADIQIKGISKWKLAKFVRSMPDRGGVGTYCHTQSVHVDIGPVRNWNWRCRKHKTK